MIFTSKFGRQTILFTSIPEAVYEFFSDTEG